MTDHAPDDPYLATLVRAVNVLPDAAGSNTESMGASVGITLTVAGSLISGYLIPNWQWFDEMDARVTVAGGGGYAMVFSSGAQNARDMRDEAKRDATSVAGGDDRGPAFVQTAFIHLREARVYTDSRALPNGGMHWRGRLSDVSGWCLGVVSLPS